MQLEILQHLKILEQWHCNLYVKIILQEACSELTIEINHLNSVSQHISTSLGFDTVVNDS